nr:reverse transcriptase domain-containing protein [Tanacetum cinerariifolium]
MKRLWCGAPVFDDDYEEALIFDDDLKEESMPVYDTDIEDVIEKEEEFVRKGGFYGEEDNIEDVVVVANDLCSLMIQTSINVDFSKTVNSNPHELIWLQKDDQGSRSSHYKERKFVARDTNLDATSTRDDEPGMRLTRVYLVCRNQRRSISYQEGVKVDPQPEDVRWPDRRFVRPAAKRMHRYLGELAWKVHEKVCIENENGWRRGLDERPDNPPTNPSRRCVRRSPNSRGRGRGYLVRRVFVDQGTEVQVMFEHCSDNLSPSIKARLIQTQAELVGFSGEQLIPIGYIGPEVSFKNEGLCRKTMMKFTVVRESSPYNIILGRTVARTTAVFECWRLEEQRMIQEEKAKEKEPDWLEDSLVEEVLVNPAHDRSSQAYNQTHPKCQHVYIAYGTKTKGLGYGEEPSGNEGGRGIGIRANPKRTKATKAVADMQSTKTLKEMQSLSEKLPSLNQFLTRSAKRSLSFLETLKNIMKENKDDYRWTEDVERAFQEMKRLITELPYLTTPVSKEKLYVYLAASQDAVLEEEMFEMVVLLTFEAERWCLVERGYLALLVHFKWILECDGRNLGLCHAMVLSKDVHELFGADTEETSVLESRIETDYYMAQVPASFYESDGSKRGQVYKFLRSHEFVSSHDTAHHYTDSYAHKV